MSSANGAPAGAHPTKDEARQISAGEPVVELNIAGGEPEGTSCLDLSSIHKPADTSQSPQTNRPLPSLRSGFSLSPAKASP